MRAVTFCFSTSVESTSELMITSVLAAVVFQPDMTSNQKERNLLAFSASGLYASISCRMMCQTLACLDECELMLGRVLILRHCPQR